jgi:carbohydrate kinase (thermoresistant glucokinase family)
LPIIFITGVSGSGKTTVGQQLSQKTSLPFFDGDDFHSTSNIAKMQSGTPLTDEDRMDWLNSIHEKALEMLLLGGAIFACSALKKKYRDILSQGITQNTLFVLLDGTYDLIAQRLQDRQGHYMPPALLQSQFDILERSEDILGVSMEHDPGTIVNMITQHLLQQPVQNTTANQSDSQD